MSRSPSPAPGRSLDIELSGQEIITVDLDNLDADPDDLLDVLKESKSKVSVWLKLATEYWRRGSLEPAEKLAQGAVTFFRSNYIKLSCPPIYALLANLQIARARRAPKLIIQEPRQDDMRKEMSREECYREAARFMNVGENIIDETGVQRTSLNFLTRGVLQLGTQSMDDALRTFDGVLSKQPTNIVASLGKARIFYARRQYPQALRLFQNVLKHKPNCDPDPRIGIGLCLWAMDHKEKAKMAWERSLEVNPDSWPAQLLLGLDAINSSKDENQSEVERRQEFLMGTRMVEKAFKANQRNSAAANALCELLLRKGQHKNALKLAERTLQFADTLTILTEGHIRCGRVLHEQGAMSDAMRQYGQAAKGQPGNVLAAVGHAQTQLKLDEVSAAMHSLETLLQAPNTPSIEATAMLASIRAVPRPGMSNAEIAQAKLNARELYDKVAKALHLAEATHQPVNGHASALTRSQRRIADDVELHIEIAKLWFEDDLSRAERGLQEALRLSERDGKANPRLVNNLGALQHIAGRYDSARPLYERSLMDATSSGSTTDENASTSILYNLARLYEDQGEEAAAKTAYEKLLSRHPEYTDAKIRLAKMLADLNVSNEAHELLKQALVSENGNLNLRAFYTHFLMQSNFPKPAKEFVFTTLKDFDRHDIYSLCAAGWIQYHQARESRDASPKGVDDRRSGFRRSAEFYEKALHLDPQCAFAAQGLAIATAEDAVGTLGGSLGPITPDENAKRIKNARDALDVFAKVRESIDDGSVYANMGHCYYACDEYDRAIESYETASRKFYSNHNVPVLLCLCRSWYAKAIKDQSFKAMSSALHYAQSALHLHPQDKAILYNIAMIEQKAAEMLLPMSPAKRSLKEMQLAIQQAAHAQKVFQSLAADTSPVVPYSRELADQRRKYGDSLLRRCDEQITAQKQHESESQAKMEDARRKRQEEKDKLELIERERLEVLRKEAEVLAEKRKVAREQAYEWTKSSQLDVRDSDDEKEQRKARKAARVRVRPEPTGSGDEQEQRKKKRGKLRRNENAPEDEGALFSGDEDGDSKPAAKKRPKKRVVRDDDEEEEASAPRKKQIKSKEFISDSDEEMS
ncbi:RNA polymerase II-associated protein [Irpex rosettiformis]|uniref:RNA polymerase II-associated protein n=1 Tax=Irpex rosettiformis TaxID=378272 RepID=A0ACB8TSI6_9APHY|nr:RNA polymerase II-associated protein [Irpex rosettiformis]